MIKVLHIMPSYLPAHGFGGSVKTVHELCRALARKYIDVNVFTTNISLENRKEIYLNKPQYKEGLKVTYYPVSFPKTFSYSPLFADALEKNIRRFDIVHIHSVYRYTTLIGCAACRKYNKPYILNPFGALDPAMIRLKSRFKKLAYIKLFEKRNITNAAAIHVASDKEKEDIASLGFTNRVEIIPPALDLEDYPKLEDARMLLGSKFPALKGKKVILFMGRIHPKKGLDILAGAFKYICDKRPDAHLLIAGSGDVEYENKVKLLFKKKGLEGRIIFAGMLLGREKLSALHGSDVFTLPSYGENFGIAALESMACALPVVITNYVALAPEVKRYSAGFVTGCNPGEVAMAILKLLDDEALRKTMGTNGRGLAEEKFTNDKAANSVIKIYEDILRS